MKTLHEQIVEILMKHRDVNDSIHAIKFKTIASELSALKQQAEQESNNRQQSEGNANNLKTAEEIFDKYMVGYKPLVVKAMEEYAAQFKAGQENSDPEVPVISEKMIRNSCDILACHYQLSIDDIKAAITNYVSGKQETNEQPKRVSDEEKTPEAIFKDFASFNKFLYDLTQYEMEVIIAMLYEQKAYASQHPIGQENCKCDRKDKPRVSEEVARGKCVSCNKPIEQEKVTNEDIHIEAQKKHYDSGLLAMGYEEGARDMRDRLITHNK